MNEEMEFPETFQQFAKEYGFKDDKEVYTNGSYLIQIYRVRQWLEHYNKLRTTETVTEFADRCHECGSKYGKLLKQEQEIGHWIEHDHGLGTKYYQCSKCKGFDTGEKGKYCKWCGKKMVESQEESESAENIEKEDVEVRLKAVEEQLKRLKAELDYAKFRGALPYIMNMMQNN